MTVAPMPPPLRAFDRSHQSGDERVRKAANVAAGVFWVRVLYGFIRSLLMEIAEPERSSPAGG
ncbi:hypothetical protein ZHAS_00020309 [Anopheles sinensis]|uniref:Uncharacterized protein n=1 Tax=Anopheles sinensis TaxID=74873 RepID=A0A084WPQ8_ANOSI|nr:hypothetical protein ZHAS_00020309 [Anopheles sinensis]